MQAFCDIRANGNIHECKNAIAFVVASIQRQISFAKQSFRANFRGHRGRSIRDAWCRRESQLCALQSITKTKINVRDTFFLINEGKQF